MRKNLTTLLLAGATAGLAYVLARTQMQLAGAQAECDDLWHEGQDERQRAELLQDDLAELRQRLRDTESEYLSTMSKLGQARGEVTRSHDLNRQMQAAQVAATGRAAELQQASGWWVWTSPRIAPAGPFGTVSQAVAEAEEMAARYPNQDVFLLGGVDRVRVAATAGAPVWDVYSEGVCLA
ncbi:hypothetical protein [Deinococcus wulumuqiensis]|uniref:hypothetical protein n=1 Tax=Deinococcus wulumuqiensis TaxID=980427 RepID=UPI002430D65E|nr:hypothetical protein [Deinococcus wulumuqiensis]